MNWFKKLLPYLLLIFFTACKEKPEKLSKDEAIDFAKQIERTMKKGDGSLLDKGFDTEEFIDRMNLPDNAEAKGFAKGAANGLNFGTRIANEMSDAIDFAFIKHYIKDDKHHVVFRLYDEEAGTLNYHDYELVKKHGKCLVADVYIYLTGETFAETMGNLFKTLYEGSGNEGINADGDMDKINTIKTLAKSGKSEEAKEIYDKLPSYLKKAKMVKLMYVTLCAGLSPERYESALLEYKEAFPNEPNINLLMIDGYYAQGEYKKMLTAVNALDSQINKDPLMDFYRYLCYKLLDEKPTAKTFLVRVVKNMPDFQPGFIEWIAIDLKAGNKVESDSLIAVYRKKRFDQKKLDQFVNFYK